MICPEKSFRPSLFLLDLRIKRIKSSSRFFLINLIMSLTQIKTGEKGRWIFFVLKEAPTNISIRVDC